MRVMRRFLLATAMVLSLPALAFAWGGAAGDGTRYKMLQETAVVVNNSGATLSSGAVVIWDTTATAGSTLGIHVTTTTSANSIMAAGVVQDDSTANGFPMRIITRGPAQVQYAGVTSAITNAGEAVGTSTVAGQLGTGTNLGVSLEAHNGKGLDFALLWTWINPTNGD